MSEPSIGSIDPHVAALVEQDGPALLGYRREGSAAQLSASFQLGEDHVLAHPVEDRGMVASLADAFVVVALLDRLVLGEELLLDDVAADPRPVSVECGVGEVGSPTC